MGGESEGDPSGQGLRPLDRQDVSRDSVATVDGRNGSSGSNRTRPSSPQGGLDTTMLFTSPGGLDQTILAEGRRQRGASPLLDQEISAENGHGEDSMTLFIQAHMRSILKPFGDHVDELQKSMVRVQTQVLQAASVSEHNSNRLEEVSGLIHGLRSDLGQTAKQANTAAQGLEKLNGETADLLSASQRMKADLASVDGQLRKSEATIVELSSGLKGTRNSVGRMREGLTRVERDIAVRIGPNMDKLAVDLKNLETCHEGTARALSESRGFAESFHQAFLVFEKETQQQHGGIDRRFEHVEGEFTKLNRALKDVRDLNQLQEDHLNAIDGEILPSKQRLDQLEIARDDGRRRHSDIDKAVTDIQVQCNSLGVDVAHLVEFAADLRGDNIVETITKLKKEATEQAENLRKLADAAGSHDVQFKEAKKRTTALEQSHASLQLQLSKLSERVGLITPVSSRSPSCEPTTERHDIAAVRRPQSTAAHYSFKDTLTVAPVHDGTVKKEGVSVTLVRALEKLSLAARTKRAMIQIQAHDKELASNTQSISKTAMQLDNTESRVSSLEGQVASMVDDIRQISMANDLNQEYWKGLSKGLKETNRSVVDGEVLPPRANAMKLPVISRPPSSQHHHNRVMSAR